MTIGDIKRCYTYFMDEKRSVQWLKEQAGLLITEEIEPLATTKGNGDENDMVVEDENIDM